MRMVKSLMDNPTLYLEKYVRIFISELLVLRHGRRIAESRIDLFSQSAFKTFFVQNPESLGKAIFRKEEITEKTNYQGIILNFTILIIFPVTQFSTCHRNLCSQ